MFSQHRRCLMLPHYHQSNSQQQRVLTKQTTHCCYPVPSCCRPCIPGRSSWRKISTALFFPFFRWQETRAIPTCTSIGVSPVGISRFASFLCRSSCCWVRFGWIVPLQELGLLACTCVGLKELGLLVACCVAL